MLMKLNAHTATFHNGKAANQYYKKYFPSMKSTEH